MPAFSGIAAMGGVVLIRTPVAFDGSVCPRVSKPAGLRPVLAAFDLEWFVGIF
jgi:hypothetical protein